MPHCESCQRLLPHYLDDLLEAAERQQVDRHLESCESCQAALEAARDQRVLLATAARERSEGVPLPPSAVTTHEAPTVVLAPRPRRRSVFFNRYGLAVAVLLLLVGGMTGLAWNEWRQHVNQAHATAELLAKARVELATARNEARARQEQAQAQIRAIQKELDGLVRTWKGEEATQRRAFEDKHVSTFNTAPKNVAVGAATPTRIEINSKQFARPLLPRRIQARIIDQNDNRVLFERTLDTRQQQKLSFDLPANLPLGPGVRPVLELRTEGDDGVPMTVREQLAFTALEYVTYLTTDRTLYRPGDTLRFRSLTLERFTLKPAAEDLHLRFRLMGPRGVEVFKQDLASQPVTAAGKPVLGPAGRPLGGLGTGEFKLPDDLSVGEYVLHVTEAEDRFPEEKRSFLVRQPEPIRFTKELTFDRPAYSPGDHVKAKLRVQAVSPLPPGPRANLSCGYRVTCGRERVLENAAALPVNSDGVCELEFDLPTDLQTDAATIAISIDDGASPEAFVRPFPLVVRNVMIDFYPEGGQLLAGVPTRVYFRARTPAGKPADVVARIRDQAGNEITQARTLHDEDEPGLNQGLGSFSITPQAGNVYHFEVTSPIGSAASPQLPAVQNEGVGLHLPMGVVDDEIPVTVFSAGRDRELLVGAYCRGRMIAHDTVRVGAGRSKEFKLVPQEKVGGVYRITAFDLGPDEQYVPVAERLIYRRSAEKVSVTARQERPVYHPGDTVRLELEAVDEQKRPAPAVALVAVVDTKATREQRGMLAHFLLTTEIQRPEDLENAEVFLGPNPRATQALDLLLGTQGWRRFAEQGRHLAGARGADAQPVRQIPEAEQGALGAVDRKYVESFIDLQKRLGEQERAAVPQLTRLRDLEVAEDNLREDLTAEREKAEGQWYLTRQLASGAFSLLVVLTGLLALRIGLLRLSDGRNGRPWLMAGAGLLLFLFIGSGIFTFLRIDEPLRDRIGLKQGGLRPPGQIEADVAIEEPAPVPILEDDRRAAGPAPPVPVPNHGVRQVAQVPPPVGGDNEERELRQRGEYQRLLKRTLGRRILLPTADAPAVVREYAHRHDPAKDGIPCDFTETVLWQPVLVLPDGKAAVTFDLSDAVTNYQVVVLGHTLDGRLGSDRSEFAARLPFALAPTIPAEISSGDRVTVPVAITNDLKANATLDLTLEVKNLRVEGTAERQQTLEPNQTARQLFTMQPAIAAGKASFSLDGKLPGVGHDTLDRAFRVIPDGILMTGAQSGIIEGQTLVTITLPERWDEGTLDLQIQAFPSMLSELLQGLDALQQEPAVSLEQTAARLELNLLILDAMRRQPAQASPAIESQTRRLLGVDYRRLVTFECADPKQPGSKHGFDSFKSNTPDNIATASALLTLHALAREYPVDPDLLKRSRQYLLDRRDGKGRFRQPHPALTLIPEDVAEAFILGALAATGEAPALDEEYAQLRTRTEKTGDAYLLALAAQAQRQRHPETARALATRLAKLQHVDGHLDAATTSVTGSGGRDLTVETTSLALLAWLQCGDAGLRPNIERALRWVRQQRDSAGGFGATQATLLALKAPFVGGHVEQRPPQDANVSVRMQDDPASRQAIARASTVNPLTLRLGQEQGIRPGRNTIIIEAGHAMPYVVRWSYRARQLADGKDCAVHLTTSLSHAKATLGDTVKLSATVENASGKRQGMTVAVVGLPAGLSLPDDRKQLDDLTHSKDDGKTPGRLSAWELRGRELILVWRDLAPDAKATLELDLVCRLPGQYTGPASRAYVVYDAQHQQWAEPLGMTIQPDAR